MTNAATPSRLAISTQTATLVLVIAAFCFGLAPWFAKGLTQSGRASPAIAFFRFSTSAIVLLMFLNLSRQKQKATLWAISSGIAIGFGWIGYVEALKVAPVSTVGVVYMTYPLFTLLIARLWLKQLLTIRSFGVGFLVLGAAMVALSPALAAPKLF